MMTQDYLNRLNEGQYQAVTTTEGPVLMLAGAGSGKTFSIISRVAYLIDKGVRPERILLLTFTNKAADEMKNRAEKMAGEGCGKITACTYHSFCARMLRQFAPYAGISRDFSIMTPSDCTDVMGRLRAKRHLNKLRKFPPAKAIISMISDAVNKKMTLLSVLNDDKFHKYADFYTEICELRKDYEEYKKEKDLLDYDDLLTKFRDMLKTNEGVRKAISDRYLYIMVDEYQDTNLIQDEIVMLLRKDCRNLAVVGDDSQSIYRFRGAEVKNIIGFPKRMDGCRIVKLTDNYRSNQKILDLANYVINRHSTEGFPKEMRANHSRGGMPVVIHTEDQFKEAERVLELIEDELKNGIPAQEIAVLYRNSFQSAKLEALLTNRGITFEKYGGIKFLELSYILDALAYLRVISNPHDEIAWYRILQVYDGVGERYAQDISELAVEKGDRLLIDHPHPRHRYAGALASLYVYMQEWRQEEDPAATLKKVISHYLGTKKNTIKNMRLNDESMREEMLEGLKSEKQDLDILVEMAGRFDDIPSFIDSITLDQSRKPETDDDCIILSTIHSAKGLEFTTVIILDCVDGIFPSCEKGSPEDNEELRCFYVAVTRAKERLYIMQPMNAMRNGKYFWGGSSHYLDNDGLYDVVWV